MKKNPEIFFPIYLIYQKNMKFFCTLEPNNLIAFLQSTYMIVLIKTSFFVWLTGATPDICLDRFNF